MNFIKSLLIGGVFELRLIDKRDGYISFEAIGKDSAIFLKEAGGHRWQRVPPTEKRGRVHTSTITVAVLSKTKATTSTVNLSDLDWKYCRGSGPGGQHRNKKDTAVILTHKPTGIVVRAENHKSQEQNKKNALLQLQSIITATKQQALNQNISETRKEQVGSGMRGDKIRTIALQRDTVTNHLNNKKISAKKYLKGHIEEIQ